MLFNPADPYNEVAPHHPGAVGGPLSLVPPGGPPPPPPFPLTPPSFLAPPQGAPGLATSSATTAAPSPPSPTPPLCAGCRLRIVDKFYLCAVESKWHTSCLKCAECGVELENQTSCFERDGQMYCKDDYVRYSLLHFKPQACFFCQISANITNLEQAYFCVFDKFHYSSFWSGILKFLTHQKICSTFEFLSIAYELNGVYVIYNCTLFLPTQSGADL